LFAAVLAAGAAAAASASAVTLDWTVSGPATGSGKMVVNEQNDLVTGFTGHIDGLVVTFYPLGYDKAGPKGSHYSFHPNDPGPGFNTIQDVPNTTGLNLTYDDYYGYDILAPNYAVNGPGVDSAGLLFSTGRSTSEVFYNPFVDQAGFVDFYSSISGGEEATFTVTFPGAAAPAFQSVSPDTPAVPEPSAWAMMLVGFGGLGAVMRARRRPGAVAA